MSPLERRCRSLLRIYPRWYRRQRGDEMLATLLEASQPGQRWPSAHDTRALIVGGLKVRAAQDQRLTTGANLRLAAQLGVAMTLLMVAANSLTSAILMWAHVYGPYPHTGFLFASGLLGLAAVVAAWFAPRPVFVVLAAAAAAASAYFVWAGNRSAAILPVGLLVTLAALVLVGDRMPRSWLWLAGGLFATDVLATLVPSVLFVFRPLALILWIALAAPWIILGVAVLWAFLDARPAMAVAIYITCAFLASHLINSIAYWPAGFVSWPMLVYAIVAAVIASGSFWRLRRQAVL
jgi:hypothetical protein